MSKAPGPGRSRPRGAPPDTNTKESTMSTTLTAETLTNLTTALVDLFESDDLTTAERAAVNETLNAVGRLLDGDENRCERCREHWDDCECCDIHGCTNPDTFTFEQGGEFHTLCEEHEEETRPTGPDAPEMR